MQSNHSSLPARFIPFDKFHIAPLRDITPAAVKDAAQEACTNFRDRETLNLQTAENFISRKLGFKGGLAGFTQENKIKLREFREKHQLVVRRDLISGKDSAFDIVSLKPRAVADRLFSQGQPLPRRIFTGYDVDWYQLNNTYFHDNPWTQHPEFKLYCLPYNSVMNEVAKAQAESAELGTRVMDAAVAACDISIRAGADNLLGDQLLWFEGAAGAELKFVPRIYRPEDCSPADFQNHERMIRETIKIFRVWIEQLEQGWVEVIPYSEHLIFLKGRDGNYDFLFPGFRDEPFNHNPFQPYLRNDDVPRSNDWYHFRRWLYFHHDGWLEEDEHRAEIFYYADAGKPKDHPGEEMILRHYFLGTKQYRQPRAAEAWHEDFIGCGVGDTWLYVSNLINIRQFKEFMTSNPEYAEYSRETSGVDAWQWVNEEQDDALPAAVTWYDANAFAAWISKIKRLPVRLLTEREYDSLARPLVQPDDASAARHFFSVEDDRLCQFFRRDGSVSAFNNLKPLLGPNDFQQFIREAQTTSALESTNPVTRYSFIVEAMKWQQSSSGLRFLVSNHFGEWLNDKPGAAVNTKYLTSVCYPTVAPSKAPFSPRSTGWYKGKKIGFRLCYLGKQSSASETAQ